MINFVLSLFLGMLPEVLFFTLFIHTFKKDKNVKGLFVFIFALYFIVLKIEKFDFHLYLLFDVILYLFMKIRYKSQINDIFIIITMELYLLIISIIPYFLIDNYILSFIINRLLLFSIFIKKEKLIKIYEKYSVFWNRHKANKVKSITIRNTTVLTVNILIVISYIILMTVL